ncbi:putative ATP-dependent helicase [Tanacetum coccineum]
MIVRIGFNSQLEDAKMVGLEAKAKTYIGKTNQEVLSYGYGDILEEAIVIFTTVSGCKERILQSINDNAFDLVIIDEAGSDLIRSRGELPYLRPYVFYDVGNGVEQTPGSSSSSSFFNERESVVCYELYNQLQDNMNAWTEGRNSGRGQERDVIILSCVRTQDLVFVSDRRRMNVALTRAKRALWVVGKKTALIHSKDWNALIPDAERRKCCHNI